MHDLMYDVVASNMDKECFIAITSRGSYPSRGKPTINDAPKLVDCPETARYIFLPFPATVNSLGTISPEARTILCDTAHQSPVQHMPKYVRALKLRTFNPKIPIRPHVLYLLRYLDLSRSHIIEVPEDITVLYHRSPSIRSLTLHLSAPSSKTDEIYDLSQASRHDFISQAENDASRIRKTHIS